MRYRSVRPDDAALRARLRELAAVRRRFGYRRLQLLLRREGTHVNHKKLRRLYREERLQVRRRGGRKRALGTRAPMVLPQGPNQRWSMDFVSDTLTDSRRFRMLAVVDDFTRECLALVADTSLSGVRVGRELDAIIARRGRPHVDCQRQRNGTDQHGDPELVAGDADRLALHRARQAHPERLHRELQRPAPRRAVERDTLQIARSRSRGTGRSGRTTTTPSGRTAPSATCRLRFTPNSAIPGCNGTGRLSCFGGSAPRPVAPPSQVGSNARTGSTSNWMKEGAQVTLSETFSRDLVAPATPSNSV